MSTNPQIHPYRRQEEEDMLKEEKVGIPFPGVWGISLGVQQLIVLSLMGFLMSRAQLLGGLHPFAPAFLAAVAVSYRRQAISLILPVAVGLYTAMPLADFWVYLAIISVASALFAFYPLDKKKQWYLVPALVFSCIAVIKGCSLAIGGGDSYGLFVTLFEGLFAAGLSVVFLVAFSAWKRLYIQRRFSTDELICCFVLVLGLVAGFGDWTIGGIELRQVASRVVILLAAALGGAGHGAGIGAMMGIVPSLSELVAPSIIGIYAFAGFLAGAFNSFGRTGILMGFILGNLILSIYILPTSEMAGAVITSALAGVIFFAIPRGWIRELKKATTQPNLRSAKEEKSERLLRLSVRRLRNAGDLFQELGKDLLTLSEKEEPGEDSIHTVLNHLSRQMCSKCSVQEICWRIDYSKTYKGVMDLFQAAEKNGAAAYQDVPENFRKRCPHVKELLASINCLYEMYCRSSFWQAQKKCSQNLIAHQMLGTAQVLEQVAREIGGFSQEREALERDLAGALIARGLPVDGAGVNFIDGKSLSVWVNFPQCPGEAACRSLLEQEISLLLGKKYEIHEHSCTSKCGENCSFFLLEAGAHKMEIGKAQLAKAAQGVCGDQGGAMMLESGKQLVMISDGMGIGAKAAAHSGVAIDTLSKYLEIGFSKDTAIDSVNASLALQGNEEALVTLDLCVVDLYSGGVEFVKTGAAPSFIKRGDEVQVVKGASLPVGILSSVEKECIQEQIQDGDMIIMASDGLMDADKGNGYQWIIDEIASMESDDPQELAEQLLAKAIARSGGDVQDDITILVAEMTA